MKSSIKTKINVSVIVIFAILFILFYLVIDDEIKDTVTPLNASLTNQLVNARGNQISYWLEQRKIELEMMSYSIISLNMDGIQAREYIKSVFEEKSNIYYDMGIVKFGGYMVGTDSIGRSISREKYYKNILKENARFIISEPIKSENTKENIVVMLYKVGGVNRDIEYIYAEVPIEKILYITSKINVYDGVGQLLVKNRSIDNMEPNNHLKSLESKNIVFETNIDSARGWTLNYYVSENDMNNVIDKIPNSLIGFGIVLIIIMVILLNIISTSIIKPIEKLQSLMKKVEEGNLAVRLQSKGKDEIAKLAHSFNQMVEKLDKAKYRQKAMRLRIMQEQIKPHFLYNTLDTIKWVAMDDNNEEVVSLIESLNTYFRIGLSNGKNFITLEQELDHIDSYLRIQKARYEDRLIYEISYEDCLVDCWIIRILLQPIVENAIIHGIDKMAEQGKISIYICHDSEKLIMKIMNNNDDIPKEKLELIRKSLKNDIYDDELTGYGLYSVNHRIKMEHGEKYGLDLVCEKGWTIATLTCPIILKGE